MLDVVPGLAPNHAELSTIAGGVVNYLRMPFAAERVPGGLVEQLVARALGGEQLPTYDFVDVVNAERRVGWQVKSTLASTPVTWKRAKIEGREAMIEASEQSGEGLQALGDAILRFCNQHVIESLERYRLEGIGYVRVIKTSDEIVVFDRPLVSEASPDLFTPSDFRWTWSTPREPGKKEQLSALHGHHRATGDKWFSWHGRGENQLHFTGERLWWPPQDSSHRIARPLPSSAEKIDWERLDELLG